MQHYFHCSYGNSAQINVFKKQDLESFVTKKNCRSNNKSIFKGHPSINSLVMHASLCVCGCVCVQCGYPGANIWRVKLHNTYVVYNFAKFNVNEFANDKVLNRIRGLPGKQHIDMH